MTGCKHSYKVFKNEADYRFAQFAKLFRAMTLAKMMLKYRHSIDTY